MSTWVLISSLDAPTSGVFDFPSLSLGAYSAVQVVASGITVTTDGTDIKLTIYQSGSETTGGTSYRWGMHIDASSGSGNSDTDNAAPTYFIVSNDALWDVGNNTSEGIGFVATFDDPGSTTLSKKAAFEAAWTNPDGNLQAGDGAGAQNGTAAIGGFKVGGTSNLTAGKVRILGLA